MSPESSGALLAGPAPGAFGAPGAAGAPGACDLALSFGLSPDPASSP
ncbi:hypothetical protein HMPREF1861_00175 [Corynebacterium kroppenstedtii]|nr:hypothetical protein HMPREF1861_00175 [Corynebacterium kroppenstedtii]